MSLRNGLLIILGVVLLVAGGRWLTEKPEGALREVPSRFHGVWVTFNPEYSDRYVKLGSGFITFGTGGVNSQRFEVTGVDTGRNPDGGELNTIFFRGVDGSKFSREFYYDRDGRGHLVFRNQPEVEWIQE